MVVDIDSKGKVIEYEKHEIPNGTSAPHASCCAALPLDRAGTQRTPTSKQGASAQNGREATATSNCGSFSKRLTFGCPDLIKALGDSEKQVSINAQVIINYLAEPNGLRALDEWYKAQN